MRLRDIMLLLLAFTFASANAGKWYDSEIDTACNCPNEWKQKELNKIMQEIQDDDELNMKVDSAARFRGGDSLLRVYMQSRIINPAKDYRDSVKYSILTRFIVERNGKISNVLFLTHTDDIFMREAERFMATMPRWTPAIAKGKKVRSWNLLRLYFGYPDANNPQEEEIPEEILREMEEQRLAEEEAKIREIEKKENFRFSEQTKRQFREAKELRNNIRRNYDYY